MIIPKEKEGCQTASVDGSSQGSAATEDRPHVYRLSFVLDVVVFLDEDSVSVMDNEAIY